MSSLKKVVFVLVAVFMFLISTAVPSQAIATDLLITGIVDGPLTGGIPKAVELYVVNDIPDLSLYGVGTANNGGGTDGQDFTFPADSATAGQFIYVATEDVAFTAFFGFVPDYISSTAVAVNGDDAVELFANGSVIDTFGDINLSGTGQPWDYLDGWAYRLSSTEADGAIFNLANWSFSGTNALDNETSNATAANPFPLGTFTPLVGDAAPGVASTAPANGAADVAVDANITLTFSEDVTTSGSWFEITCATSGVHTAVASGGPTSFTLDPDTDFANAESCTVTVLASQVTDTDTNDPPDAMSTDVSFSFTTVSLTITSVVINEFLADPAADLPGDANGDGVRDDADDEFIELVNVSGADLDVSGWSISDGVGVRHTFPTGSIIEADCTAVIFGGDTPTGTFGGALVQTASSGTLGLNNGGDTITLDDGQTSSLTYVYGSEGGNDQSIARDPDTTGSYVLHSTATASGGALFSPGTQLDGTPFSGCTFGIPVTIMEIQGEAHLSPLVSQSVQTEGVVTSVRSNGFNLQDPSGDGNDATSDAIFVFTGSAPGVAVGDALTVIATVAEFYPGGFGPGNVSTTELTGASITVNSSGNPLPAYTILGNNGRIPPNTIIDDDSTGDVNSSPTFDPANDGIDFYESLEGMLVQVNDALVVGGTGFGEILVVGDLGANATGLSPRGGVVIGPNDFNPERIMIDDALIFDEPDASVGDTFAGPIVGVMDYSFGNYKILNTEPLPAVNSNFVAEMTNLASEGTALTVATFNVENLSPNDSQDKFDALANQIVNNLGAPAILSIEEIQDNTGFTNDGVTDASQTYGLLIAAIQAAGGPVYEYRDIAPIDLTDGGAPGGNIRVGFLFRPDRVTFVDRAGGDAVTGTAVSIGTTGLELSVSPGRIDPTNAAWLDSRKPLAGEFIFGGQKIIVVANHFNSKGGDDPLFGRVQPPVLTSEVQRLQQAAVVNSFVQQILALDPNANVIVMGDLNDFQFSAPIDLLEGNELHNLIETLPATEQYTYQYEGNLQVLDHILVSDNLFNSYLTGVDVVHGNAELDTDLRVTDHDPVVAQFTLPAFQNGDGCYVVALEGSPFTGVAAIVAPGDPGYNGIRFNAAVWGKAQDLYRRACYEIHGTNNSEIIIGGNGDDVIFGYDGHDLLIGLRGDDTFIGGSGADFFSGNQGRDEVLDYERHVDTCSSIEQGCRTYHGHGRDRHR